MLLHIIILPYGIGLPFFFFLLFRLLYAVYCFCLFVIDYSSYKRLSRCYFYYPLSSVSRRTFKQYLYLSYYSKCVFIILTAKKQAIQARGLSQ